MTVEERIRQTLTTAARSVDPPPIDLPRVRSGALRVRHRRQAMVAVAGVVVVMLAALLGPHVVLRGTSSPPAGSPSDGPKPVTGVPPFAVWYDDAGLHHGSAVLPLDHPPVNLALVAKGAVYQDSESQDIVYQPWSGKAHVIAESKHLGDYLAGPAADPRGSTAAWFDGADLVMFDTDKNVELARKLQQGRVPGFYRENQMGRTIHYVDRNRVVWLAQSEGGVYSFDRRTGVVSEIGRAAPNAAYPADVFPGLVAANTNRTEHPQVSLTRDDGTVLYQGGVGSDPIRFSPDGRFLLVVEESASYGPVVVDTRSGEPVIPVRSTTYPWVGWAYDDTLMYLQQSDTDAGGQRGRLLVYDPNSRDTHLVESRGTVVLPSN